MTISYYFALQSNQPVGSHKNRSFNEVLGRLWRFAPVSCVNRAVRRTMPNFGSYHAPWVLQNSCFHWNAKSFHRTMLMFFSTMTLHPKQIWGKNQPFVLLFFSFFGCFYSQLSASELLSLFSAWGLSAAQTSKAKQSPAKRLGPAWWS